MQMLAKKCRSAAGLLWAPPPCTVEEDRQSRQTALLAERARFADLTTGRLPTPAENAQHVDRIDRILRGQDAA